MKRYSNLKAHCALQESIMTKSADADEVGRMGYAPDGTQFVIPATLDTLAAFHPANVSFSTGLTMCCVALWTYLTVYEVLPLGVQICLFFFWRCCYNIGIGFILNNQSLYKGTSNFYTRHIKSKSSIGRILKYLAKSSVRAKDYNPDDYPDEFNAWLAYKCLVNFVLLNDSSNFVLLGYRCFNMPPLPLSWFLIAQYTIGVLLAIFNWCVKVDAYRCIGTYCWYWGDFFWSKDQSLTFDGIFELFPHPMYTVGYSVFYGYTLICRSYTMLFISITAHMMQIIFLVCVEEPHIKRTYGNESGKVDQLKYSVLYDPKSGLFPGKSDTLFFSGLNFIRSSGDLSLILLTIYSLTFCYLVEDKFWCAIQVVVWQTFHWFGLGGVLFFQSRYEWYTQSFLSNGRPLYEAFSNWKRVYNISVSMNMVVFIGCAFRYFRPLEEGELYSNEYMARLAIGFLLVLFNIWSSTSSRNEVGEFGWFYGDFFIKRDSYENHLCYTGIYRFLNNPDLVTGYCSFYAACLITRSNTIFALAIIAQGLNFAFLYLVEQPHMNKLYNQELRETGPIAKKLSTSLEILDKKLRSMLRKRVSKSLKESYKMYKTMRKTGDASSDVQLNAPRRLYIGDPLTVTYRTKANHSKVDWIGIYPAHTQTKPGKSNGRWIYVPAGAEGSVLFSPAMLPTEVGLFEIRYHYKNGYEVESAVPIIISVPPNGTDTDDEIQSPETSYWSDKSPMNSPMKSPVFPLLDSEVSLDSTSKAAPNSESNLVRRSARIKSKTQSRT